MGAGNQMVFEKLDENALVCGRKACMYEGGVDGGRGERRSVRQGYRLVKAKVKAMI